MAITPAQYNIRPQRRADFPLELKLKDSTGAALNLTGWQVYAQVWDKNRTVKVGDFTTSVLNAVEGHIKITLSHTVTVLLPDECRYDVMLVNPSGLREYYVEGIVRPSQGFTAPA